VHLYLQERIPYYQDTPIPRLDAGTQLMVERDGYATTKKKTHSRADSVGPQHAFSVGGSHLSLPCHGKIKSPLASVVQRGYSDAALSPKGETEKEIFSFGQRAGT